MKNATKSRRKLSDILKMMKEKNYEPGIVNLAKISLEDGDEIEMFSDKQKFEKICKE